MLTYWVENKQMEPQQSPYISKEQGKIGSKNKKSKQKKNWHRNVRSDENATKESFGQNKHLLYTWKKYLHDKNISRH